MPPPPLTKGIVYGANFKYMSPDSGRANQGIEEMFGFIFLLLFQANQAFFLSDMLPKFTPPQIPKFSIKEQALSKQD
jgi:hypothetical protein